jgi:hypothetical protein
MTWKAMEDIIQKRRRENEERRTRHTAPSENKNVHTTKKPPAEISVKSSSACRNTGWNRNERSTTFSGCIIMVFTKLIRPSRQEIPCHSWKCKDAKSVSLKRMFVSGGVEIWWHAGWDMIWRPCSTDWTWQYMRFGQERGERRMGLTSHTEWQTEFVRYSESFI